MSSHACVDSACWLLQVPHAAGQLCCAPASRTPCNLSHHISLYGLVITTPLRFRGSSWLLQDPDDIA